MLKKLVITLAFIATALPALSASWDSEANIDKAMDQAVSAYKAGGIDGLVAAGKNCYAGLDTSRTNKYAARDVEYCIALEISAAKISNGSPAYFSPSEFIPRGISHLEKARVITLPEQVDPYFDRFKIINLKLPTKL